MKSEESKKSSLMMKLFKREPKALCLWKKTKSLETPEQGWAGKLKLFPKKEKNLFRKRAEKALGLWKRWEHQNFLKHPKRVSSELRSLEISENWIGKCLKNLKWAKRKWLWKKAWLDSQRELGKALKEHWRVS